MPWRRSTRAGSSWRRRASRGRRTGCGGSPGSSPPCRRRGPGVPSPGSRRASSPGQPRAGADTFLAMANDSPYPILLEDDPRDGGPPDRRRPRPGDPAGPGEGAERPPAGARAGPVRRGGGAGRRARRPPGVGGPLPRPRRPRRDEGAVRRPVDRPGRLNRLQTGGPNSPQATGPANPGFEPDFVELAAARTASVVGWELVGEAASSELDRDRPHGGRGSLRLDARGGPASITSAPFHPEARSSLLVRGWLRADRPDTRVRVRIEGQSASGATPAVRRAGPGRLDRGGGPGPAAPRRGARHRPGPVRAARPGAVVGRRRVGGRRPLGESELLNARRDLMAALEPTARSATPTSPAWPGRTGPGTSPAEPAAPPSRATARA